MRSIIYITAFLLLFVACKQSERQLLTKIVAEWNGKEIIFPLDTTFMCYSQPIPQKVNMKLGNYTIFTYVDSIGCMSCKLQLLKWDELISTVDSISGGNVVCLFIFHPSNKKDLIKLLKRKRFNYPVYIDENDTFNKLNHFPMDINFQSFLLDKDNRIVAIGNPVHNFQIKKLYLNIIQGNVLVTEEDRKLQTEIKVVDKSKYLGKFSWYQEQKVEFVLMNAGENILVLDDVTTSCGCTSVDYFKEPVRPGNSISLNVTYKADHPEHFDKTITVYCNAESSPVVLRITGDAE